jgi:hypothetical protein
MLNIYYSRPPELDESLTVGLTVQGISISINTQVGLQGWLHQGRQ